ncbi:unnamed protein product [Clonostachys solani]|uniref:Uncharacterized protein n=1 Tax=Clonostachys solani TaxID=160281 RepID=A0A9N9YTY6_9HYPO|nr:unnamed protein product [Clonostachys solani]
MTPQPFRFTDLPSELRNRIYHLLLAALEEPEDFSTSPLVTVPKTITRAKHHVQTSILAVSRQIHAEAKDVLHRENKFVKFGATLAMPNVRVLKSLIKSKRVPVFTTDRTVMDRFNGHVISYALLERPTDLPKSSFYCLISHRHLDLFCRGLANAEIATPGFWTNITHTITLCAPYQISPSAATSHQGNLVAPFCRHLRGLHAVLVRGEIDHSLATIVAERLKALVSEDPQIILENLAALKEAGNDFFRQGDSRMCSESWARACMEIRRVRGGAMWKTLTSDPAFARDLTELYFILNLNLSQNTIKNMEGHSNHPDLVAELANSALIALENAFEGLSDCHSYWQPSDAQMAKLWYRKSKTHRLCSDYGDALQAITFAENLLPDDAMIQQERRTIKSRMP